MLITCDDDSFAVARKMGSHLVYTTSDCGYVEMCVAHVYNQQSLEGQNIIIEFECMETLLNYILFNPFWLKHF